MAYSGRAGFVTNEYRYAEKSDTSVQTQSASADTIQLDSNADLDGATQLATELLADLKRSTVTYTVDLDDVTFTGDSLNGSPPMFTSNLLGYGAKTGQRCTTLVVDWNTFTNTLNVRG